MSENGKLLLYYTCLFRYDPFLFIASIKPADILMQSSFNLQRSVTIETGRAIAQND
jgi:hypothetical protein